MTPFTSKDEGKKVEGEEIHRGFRPIIWTPRRTFRESVDTEAFPPVIFDLSLCLHVFLFGGL